jgi:hypothetical protein
MALSNAERQAVYRRNRATAGENGERQIRTWVTTGTALARLARHHSISQRAMLERLITAADERIIKRLDPDTPGWNDYLGVTS